VTVRLLLAPCCHDTIDLDPPDTEYLMLRVKMEIKDPLPMERDADGELVKRSEEYREPYVGVVDAEQPYHVACLRAGRGMKEGVSFEQVSIPGPLGTRRLAKRSEL
jgi:hypothetical protein